MRFHAIPTTISCSQRLLFIGIFLLALLLGNAEASAATTEEFDATQISPEFIKDANGIVRQYRHSFTVESPDKATEHVFKAVTILNQNGREFGHLVIFYDHYRKIKSLRATILDSQGTKIRNAKNQEIKDYSAIAGYSLYEDDRVRYVELYSDQYPYTVTFEYEIEYNGLVGWPTWYPQWDSNLPIESASFELTVPNSMNARYRLRGDIAEPKAVNDAKSKTFYWQVTSLPKCEVEPYSYGWNEQAPAVVTAPSVFQFDVYQGDMSSWGAFANWCEKLTKGRQSLPAPALEQVQQLCTDITDPRAKVRKLYEHLQATTRYVSIQLGIGGWQPFDATFVYEKGYGDCKALTNYMRAMLMAVNIPSFPAYINRGDDEPEIIPDFPSNQFNHVILFVPLASDTLWLECTSTTSLCGHLGMDDEDRYALVALPDGGRLMKTPCSKSTDNMQISQIKIKVLNERGDAWADVAVRYTGNQQDRVRNALAQGSVKEREDWLREQIDAPSFDIEKSDFGDVDRKQPEVALIFSMSMLRFINKAGTRFLLRPNLMQRWRTVPKEMKQRTQPVNLGYAFIDVDTISYQIPAKWSVEAAPPEAKFETSFASYYATVMFHQGTVDYIRRLEFKVNSLPATQYGEFRDFYEKVVKADRMQMVFVSKGI